VFLAGKFLFVLSVLSDTYAAGRLATKRTEKKRVGVNASGSFYLDRQSDVHGSCYVLLVASFVNFDESRLSGLSLDAFINSTR